MAAPSLSRDRLRHLAELRPTSGKVISAFLNLDPSEFATGAARATAITSLLTDASHRIDRAEHLEHAERIALKEDVERVREVLQGPDLAQNQTRGIAVYACGPADLLEVVRLPQPVESRIVLDDSPFVEPLVSAADADRWCVLITTRRDARVFHGTAESLEEMERFTGAEGDSVEDRATQHTTDRAAEQHLRAVGERLSRLLKAQPFDCLLVGAPDEIAGQVEAALHPYVRERLCGRVHVDWENATGREVTAAAAPVIEQHRSDRERSALDRFAQEAGRGGRAAAGLGPVLEALNEHRVELLLLEDGFRAGGAIETTTGLLTVDGGNAPVDDPQFEGRDDIVESAIERAVEQSADVLVIRRFPDLRAHGGIGALLRF